MSHMGRYGHASTGDSLVTVSTGHTHRVVIIRAAKMSENEDTVDDGLVNTVIDTNRLIIEIEKRPDIYNKELKEYSDRNIKDKLWAEVCVNMYRNWNELSAAEKKNKGKETHKKWKHLKDCFAREMAVQRKTTSGQGAKKRRKYIQFDALLFLVPFVQGTETSGNISHPVRENNEEQEHSPDASSNLEDDGHCISRRRPTGNEQVTPIRPVKGKKPNVTSYETSLLNILKERQGEEINEDKNFALMLVPMLGKLSDDQKHYAKVEILNVMLKARNFHPQPHQQSFFGDPLYRHYQQGSSQAQPTQGQFANQPHYSQNTGPMQNFYHEVAASLLSPSSASESDLFDMSNH